MGPMAVSLLHLSLRCSMSTFYFRTSLMEGRDCHETKASYEERILVLVFRYVKPIGFWRRLLHDRGPATWKSPTPKAAVCPALVVVIMDGPSFPGHLSTAGPRNLSGRGLSSTIIQDVQVEAYDSVDYCLSFCSESCPTRVSFLFPRRGLCWVRNNILQDIALTEYIRFHEGLRRETRH
jgi:hypothetical protein